MVNYHQNRLKINKDYHLFIFWNIEYLPSIYNRLLSTVTDAPARRLFIDAIGVHLSYDGQ